MYLQTMAETFLGGGLDNRKSPWLHNCRNDTQSQATDNEQIYLASFMMTSATCSCDSSTATSKQVRPLRFLIVKTASWLSRTLTALLWPASHAKCMGVFCKNAQQGSEPSLYMTWKAKDFAQRYSTLVWPSLW